MNEDRASFVRSLVEKYDIENILELGFLHGKSSAYFAAMLEDRGKGRLVTIDLEKVRTLEPSITQLLDQAGLAGRATPIFAKRSFTWELARMIAAEPRPQFDFCYLDGGKTWDTEGFGFFLVDVLLKPGGLILFDDLYWSMAASPYYRQRPEELAGFDEDEVRAQPIKLIWDTIVPHLGYTQVEIVERFQWGLAQKPQADAAGARRPAPAMRQNSLERLVWSTGRRIKRELRRLR